MIPVSVISPFVSVPVGSWLALIGGVLALGVLALGWLDLGWLAMGLLGLAAYAWLFGFNGDPSKLIEQVSDALEVKETLETLTQVAGATESASTGEEMKVGMPNF